MTVRDQGSEGGSGQAAGGAAGPPLLRIARLSKTFPGQRALDGVDVTLHRGRVTSVVGHNGSGKSTLIKILSGYEQPDPGVECELDGHALPLDEATASLGFRFMHQDLALVDTLTVAENFFVGDPAERPLWTSSRRDARRATDHLRSVGLDGALAGTMVGDLSMVERRMVALARCVSSIGGGGSAVRAIALDEPTEGLVREQATAILALIRRVTQLGIAVLFVSHRIEDVVQISDEITLFRDGRVAHRWGRGEVDVERLTRAVAGDDDGADGAGTQAHGGGAGAAAREQGAAATGAPDHQERPVGDGVPALQVSDLSTSSLRRLSMAVQPGEVVGITGPDGSGRDDLLPAIFGALRTTGSTLRVFGSVVRRRSPHASVSRGVVYVPRDRAHDGMIAAGTVRENVLLTRPLRRSPLGWLSVRRERAETRRWAAFCAVTPNTPEMACETLSGGNQQKVMLARALRAEPRVLLVDEPFAGVDEGARAVLARCITGFAAQGNAVLVAAAEMGDLTPLCTRIVSLDDGRIRAGRAPAGDLTGAGLQ